MADDITETVSTVPKMPEIPPRKSDRYAKSGEEMIDILVDDMMRYEELSELPLNRIELNRLYFSKWCMVTESIMKWVF